METVIATLVAVLSFLGYSNEQISQMNPSQMEQTIIQTGHADLIEQEEGNM